jgi:hypothetical protein
MGANAVAPLGGTVDWGERSTAHWMTNQWIATGTHTYNVAVSKTAPAAPGTYHIVVAFSGEFNTAQVFSSTNWSALPGQVSTWNDGNDVGFDWGPEQFATAQRDGALLRHVQFTAASGYLAQHLPAAVVTVRVLPPAHGRVANDIGTVKLLDGGSLNGNAVVPAHPIIRVLPGDPIHGHLVVESNNWMGANAVAPLGGTVDWGARETAHWMTNQWISTGVGTYNVEVDREAPALPGIYHIVVAFSGEYNTAQVFSRTSWASLPGQASTWSDGNDVGFDWGIEEFASARANGSVLTYKQYSPTTFDAQHLPATVVTVQVLPPAAGGQDTDADGQADSDDADDDNDEIPDTTEIANGTDPLLYDSDHDGLTDAEEATLGTNPLDADTDHDGLADGTEVLLYNTNPATKDSDSDGLSDGDEMFIHGTSPLLKDTDGDGFDDKFELDTGYSPISGTSTPEAFSEMITAVEFHFNGAAGKSYTIESSTDLKTWTTVETGIAGTGGMISRFYSVQGIPKRYFRVGREQ